MSIYTVTPPLAHLWNCNLQLFSPVSRVCCQQSTSSSVPARSSTVRTQWRCRRRGRMTAARAVVELLKICFVYGGSRLSLWFICTEQQMWHKFLHNFWSTDKTSASTLTSNSNGNSNGNLATHKHHRHSDAPSPPPQLQQCHGEVLEESSGRFSRAKYIFFRLSILSEHTHTHTHPHTALCVVVA